VDKLGNVVVAVGCHVFGKHLFKYAPRNGIVLLSQITPVVETVMALIFSRSGVSPISGSFLDHMPSAKLTIRLARAASMAFNLSQ
jgi:ribonucleotide reductase alpha subunit